MEGHDEERPGIWLADNDHALAQRSIARGVGTAQKTEKDYKRRMAQHKRAANFALLMGVAITAFHVLRNPITLTGLAASAVIAFFPKPLDMAATHVFATMPEPAVVQKIDAAADCAEYMTILDRDAQVLGYLPKFGNCPSRAHSYLPVTDEAVLEHAGYIETVEGPFDGPGVILNVSAEGMARALYYTMKDETAGGTIPILSAIEFVAGEPSGLGLVDKSKFLFYWGPTFIGHHLPLVDDRKKFAVEHLPCARPMPGTGAKMLVISGGFCSRLLGKPAGLQGLNAAEHCLIVASYKHQLPIVGPKGEAAHHARMAAAFDALKDRADRTCLSERFEGVELDRARGDLAAIPMPDPSVLVSELSGFTTVAPGAATFMRDARARGQSSDTTLGIEALTLDRDANAQMTKSLRRSVQRDVKKHLNPKLCWGAACDSSRQAQVAMTVARLDDTGLLSIDAAYQSRSELLLPRSDGRRNTASTSKAMLLPLLVEHGIFEVCIAPGDWPRRPPVPSDDGNCGAGLLPISMEDAVAVSSNAAFLAALKKVPEAELKGYLRLLGYWFDPALTGRDLREGVVKGWGVGIGPDELLRNMAFIVSGRPVTLPQVYDIDVEADFTFGGFVGHQSLSLVRPMLEAPLRKPYGTLYGLADGMDAAGCGHGAIGKSGTADATTKKARDRLIIGAFACDDGDFRVFFSLFGSPSDQIELGKDIRSTTTNGIVASALSAYAKETLQ